MSRWNRADPFNELYVFRRVRSANNDYRYRHRPTVTTTSPISVGNGLATVTTNPPQTTTTNTGSTQTTQNGTTTTSNSVAGAVPVPVVPAPIAAPSNVGPQWVGHTLAEQVQLSSQITTLRLLLQGALSDQYLSRNSVAVGVRRQTTLGFAVTLDPPRQFKHAVAEVRVIIEPPNGLEATQNPISIMTLLPSEKTYNVAKVTSHQSAYGAGAVIEPISVGGSVTRGKDRLYLAKDTDTLALQLRPREARCKVEKACSPSSFMMT